MCDRSIRYGDQIRRCLPSLPPGHKGDCVYKATKLELIVLGKRKLIIRWQDR